MSCDACRNGDLTTIQFVDSGFTAEFTSIGGATLTRAVIENDVLGTMTCREKCPGDKIDYGSIALEWCFDPDSIPDITGPVETVIITFPPSPSQTNGATFTAKAFLTEFKVADAVLDEKMTASAVLTITCDPDPVFAPGS